MNDFYQKALSIRDKFVNNLIKREGELKKELKDVQDLLSTYRPDALEHSIGIRYPDKVAFDRPKEPQEPWRKYIVGILYSNQVKLQRGQIIAVVVHLNPEKSRSDIEVTVSGCLLHLVRQGRIKKEKVFGFSRTHRYWAETC